MAETHQEEASKKSYLRPSVRTELQADIDGLKAEITDPNPVHRIQDPQTAKSRLGRMQKQLDDQAAPEVSSQERPALEARQEALQEHILKTMPSRDMMMKNPPGSVGRNIAHHKKTKAEQVEWKNNQLRLHPDSNDPDLANLERIRPVSDRSVDYTGSQIGGEKTISVPTEQYMQNHDQIEWASKAKETIDKQASVIERMGATMDRLSEKLDKLEEAAPKIVQKVKRTMSPEQLEASRERLVKARAKGAAKVADRKRLEAEAAEKLQEDFVSTETGPSDDAA